MSEVEALPMPIPPVAAPAPKAADLVAALERHYTGGDKHRDADSHATYTEVPHGPDGVGRRIDFLAVSLWGSRGHRMEGHEIKVSRADWLAELAQPDKAETWWPLTSRWWLVVPDASIVRDGELPPGWGLMVPPSGKNGRTMKVVTEPSERSPEAPLWLLARLLLRDKRGAAEVRREIEHATEQKVREQERQNHERERLSEEDRKALRTVHDIRSLLPRAGSLVGLSQHVTEFTLARALATIETERHAPRRHDKRELEGHAERADRYAAALRQAAKLAEQDGAGS